MAKNLNSVYHKGTYRNREWAKHLRPYGKRLGNKRFRKTGKNSLEGEDVFAMQSYRSYKKKKQKIRVKITYNWAGGITTTTLKSFNSKRDAENSIRRHNVVKIEFLKGKFTF